VPGRLVAPIEVNGVHELVCIGKTGPRGPGIHNFTTTHHRSLGGVRYEPLTRPLALFSSAAPPVMHAPPPRDTFCPFAPRIPHPTAPLVLGAFYSHTVCLDITCA